MRIYRIACFWSCGNSLGYGLFAFNMADDHTQSEVHKKRIGHVWHGSTLRPSNGSYDIRCITRQKQESQTASLNPLQSCWLDASNFLSAPCLPLWGLFSGYSISYLYSSLCINPISAPPPLQGYLYSAPSVHFIYLHRPSVVSVLPPL